MVDTISNMQLADLKYKPRVGKSLRNTIDISIVARFYPPPGSENYKILRLDQFCGPSHINCEKEKKSEIRRMNISNAHNSTTNTHANKI